MRLVVLVFLFVLSVPPARAATPPVIMVLGDSLSAGYGLSPGQGWVDLLARRLAERGYPHRVVNASVSGDTTAGGAYRVGAALTQHRPGLVLVELGGNDGLRGLPLAETRANLDRIVADSQAAGARALILGMQLPPNYGRAYAEKFQSLYAQVARERKAPLVPFILEGFAHRLELFQPDRIHPKAEAQGLILDNVWPALEPLLKAGAKKPARAAAR